MLLDEIIGMLGDPKTSLSDALLKTKILLHQIGKKELADWVNSELNGYSETAPLPAYRMLNASVRCNAASIGWQYTDVPVPIAHLKDEMRDNLIHARMHQSLTVLEDMASSDGQLRRQLPLEWNGLLGKTLEQGVQIQMAWCITPTHDVKGILTQVRSRLLDFMLELKDGLGEVAVTNENLKAETAKLDTTEIFNRAVFSGTTNIFMGNNSIQHLQINIREGDISALTQTLNEAGIEADDTGGEAPERRREIRPGGGRWSLFVWVWGGGCCPVPSAGSGRGR